MDSHQALLAALAELAFDPRHVVPSPCVSVCRIDDASQECQGCHRTMDEIIDWGRLGEDDKRRVWRALCRRAGLPFQPPPEPRSATAERP